MINNSLSTTFRIIFGILHNKISKKNNAKKSDTTIYFYESRLENDCAITTRKHDASLRTIPPSPPQGHVPTV